CFWRRWRWGFRGRSFWGVVEPHDPRAGGRGRPPVGVAAMLRIYFLQQWFALSDRQMEDGLYDIESLRRFAGFSNVTAALPDETTILNFRHLLEQHDLTTRLLEAANGLLKAKGLLGVARDDGRRHHHPCALFDQECQGGTRPGDAPDQERQSVVFRHEDPYRCGCR